MAFSSLSWLDASERERRQALDLIKLFGDEDTRDELGLASIRDGFADLLFPGTGTMQTRARYFFFIPWMYLELEGKGRGGVPSSEIAAKARKFEVRVMDALAESDDREGIIGIESRERLRRLPSSIYWNGLRKWGIRAFPGSQDEYHRSLDGFYRRRASDLINDDKQYVERPARNWRGDLPAPPEDFPEKASFALPVDEAEYLRDRIVHEHPDSLLAFLVTRKERHEPVPLVWAHPEAGKFPAERANEVRHAQNFSEVMHGAALLYNLMLAEEAKSTEQVVNYTAQLDTWAGTVTNRRRTLAAWDREAMWDLLQRAGARVLPATNAFVDTWAEFALADPHAVRSSEAARNLIRDRERFRKHKLARLGNPEALKLWKGASGAGQLNYRWPDTERIVDDILAGLEAV